MSTTWRGLPPTPSLANRLYILPHRASRDSIRRRFERIDRTFDEQAAEGWIDSR